MNYIIYIAIWVLVGLWSFILTQNYIKGWDVVKSDMHPFKIFGSAMLLGPITTMFCLYVVFKYSRREK